MGTWGPWGQAQSLPVLEPPMQESQSNVKFVQDTSKFWYKPHLSRDQGEEPACLPLPPSRALSGLWTQSNLPVDTLLPPPILVFTLSFASH